MLLESCRKSRSAPNTARATLRSVTVVQKGLARESRYPLTCAALLWCRDRHMQRPIQGALSLLSLMANACFLLPSQPTTADTQKCAAIDDARGAEGTVAAVIAGGGAASGIGTLVAYANSQSSTGLINGFAVTSIAAGALSGGLAYLMNENAGRYKAASAAGLCQAPPLSLAGRTLCCECDWADEDTHAKYKDIETLSFESSSAGKVGGNGKSGCLGFYDATATTMLQGQSKNLFIIGYDATADSGSKLMDRGVFYLIPTSDSWTRASGNWTSTLTTKSGKVRQLSGGVSCYPQPTGGCPTISPAECVAIQAAYPDQ
jgi:hypothetical protein